MLLRRCETRQGKILDRDHRDQIRSTFLRRHNNNTYIHIMLTNLDINWIATILTFFDCVVQI
jgi:hypothetical protein